ncbi:MAG: dTDP-4-dehydrorhamnose reductase [Sphingomonas sp.]|uniref:dTDP-4-dehydrorhamnose reductase n=1 Tax=Sphingomonas sp. TaxID=28214 RepID=UPI001B0C79D4|nr:dTDP-4-dehydrorhamnose reductase [Sphingomonas sp.]MBO9623877.1 dTDP-4-dehydrorhamnose reductase [Sphingomonas sp.]
MRILVTGRSGQVAHCLAEKAGARHELVFAQRPAFDLLDPRTIERTVAQTCPDLIFSLAAYTAVDLAESEPDVAMATNADGPALLARAAARAGAPIIHLSTDYVFDGSNGRPYREEDPVGPLNAYGASKLAGEQAVRDSGAAFAIVRTSWIYSPFGRNFVKAMLSLAGSGNRLRVVADQLGCPTSAFDVADGLLRMADLWGVQRRGLDATYHLVGSGETDWANFARRIFAFSAACGGPAAAVDDIPSAAYPSPAKRPANSRLDNSRFAETFGYRPPDWRTSLQPVVARMVAEARRPIHRPATHPLYP